MPIRLPGMYSVGGHFQSILTELKDDYLQDYFDLEFKYDKKEEVTLSDGGKVLISMKF